MAQKYFGSKLTRLHVFTSNMVAAAVDWFCA